MADEQGEHIITPAVVRSLKDAIHQVVALFHGYGNITLVIRDGRVTRIAIEVDAWRMGGGEKGD